MTRNTPLTLGLIGSGIQASKTPALHMTEAAAQGLDLDYRLIDLDLVGRAASDLPLLLDEVEAAGFAGLNITHPCKQSVMALLDRLSPDATAISAVNTVLFRQGKRIGHNTDWSGFAESFRQNLGGVATSNVLQLGAGGAGSAVAHACWKLGVERLHIMDALPDRARSLAESLNTRAGREIASPCRDPAEVMAFADGMVNATPMGMHSHPGLPIDPSLLHSRHWVAEIVYFPLETPLLRLARTLGCRVMHGGGMAVNQAVAAFELFTGIPADPARMQAHFHRMISD